MWPATPHRVKGQEFAHVLIASVNDGVIPFESTHPDIEDAQMAEGKLRERRLLHLAGTRVRDTLTIMSSGQLSRFIHQLDA